MRYGKRVAGFNIRICAFLLWLACIPFAAHAAPIPSIPWEKAEASDEVKNILQQSLSIQELDEEIKRISLREQEAISTRSNLEQALDKEEKKLQAKQKDAGRVLRAYYMGERDMLLDAALSADRLQDIFALLDYYQFLVETDQEILTAYKSNVKRIDQLRAEQAALVRELTQVRTNLEEQRERMLQLKEDLNLDVANSSDPEAMQKLISEFTKYWQSVGLFEVRHYFQAIAQSMQKLPDFVKENGNLKGKGLEYTLSIKDEELNAFLRKQDEMFNQFQFVFKDNVIAAIGEREGLKVYVEGRYTIENEPQHAIRFHVERLQFNGLELSEVTRKDLEKQFDLNFYPQQLVSFIEAKEVKLEPHQLTVKLAVKL